MKIRNKVKGLLLHAQIEIERKGHMKKRYWFLCIGLLHGGIVSNAQSLILSIDEMFHLADEHSKSIRVHTLHTEETSQGIKVAQDKRLPSIQANLTLNYIGDGCMTDRDFSNGIHADMPHFGNTFVLKASQVLYSGGSISGSIKKSKLLHKNAQLEYDNDQQNIRFLLIGYYLDICQLNNQKTVYEKNIEQTQLLVKDMKAAYRQGTALKSDITRYELQLQNLELSLTSVLNKKNILSRHLANAIGLPEGTIIQPDTAQLKKIQITRQNETVWKEEKLKAPVLRIADNQIELKQNEERLIKAERKPRIHFTATNDFTGPILVEVPPMNNNFNYWFAGISVSYNLDALFKSKKKLKQAQISTLKTKEQRKLAEEELDNAIHAAYIGLNEAYTRFHTQQKSVQLAHENFNIVKHRYLNGLSLITDMLDASNTQLDTELQLTNDQINILYQYYLLKKLNGAL